MPYRTPEPRETTRTIVVQRPFRGARVIGVLALAFSPSMWVWVAIGVPSFRLVALLMVPVTVAVCALFLGPMFVWGEVELVADRSSGELRRVNRMHPIWPASARFVATTVSDVRVERVSDEGGLHWIVGLDPGNLPDAEISRHRTEEEAVAARERALVLLAWLRGS